MLERFFYWLFTFVTFEEPQFEHVSILSWVGGPCVAIDDIFYCGWELELDRFGILIVNGVILSEVPKSFNGCPADVIFGVIDSIYLSSSEDCCCI